MIILKVIFLKLELSKEQVEQDVQNLKKSMEGWSKDEKTIIEITSKRSKITRQEICSNYYSKYKKDLINDFKKELSGKFKELTVALYRSPLEFDVYEVFKAMDGVGTDEDALIEILCTRPSSRIEEIKTTYKDLFNKTLIEVIQDETSNFIERLLTSLVSNKRSIISTIDQEKLKKDIEYLKTIFDRKINVEDIEENFIVIFSSRSYYEIEYIYNQYKNTYNLDLKDQIKKKFDSDEFLCLSTIINYSLNKLEYFADRINYSFKGLTSKDDILIRSIVSREEEDLKEIGEFYKQKYKISLYDTISNQCSGDYKKLLLGIIDKVNSIEP